MSGDEIDLEAFEQLVARAVSELESEHFDEVVHECKSAEASAINNAGIEIQLEYITESLGRHEAAKVIQHELDMEG